MNISSFPIATLDDLAGLAIAATLLGIKHGFDADHIAAINCMVRYNSLTRDRLAQNTGILFSLGHGSIVLLIAAVTGILVKSWSVPNWIDATGAWISISLLLSMALFNLATLSRANSSEILRPVGWRSRIFSRFLVVRSGPAVFSVGALFALSYDTISIAMLFGMIASRASNWYLSLLAAGLFVAGMVITDGLNGRWVSTLLRRTDKTALTASWIMTLIISGVALLTAAAGIASQLLPGSHWLVLNQGAWISVTVVLIVPVSIFLGRHLVYAGQR